MEERKRKAGRKDGDGWKCKEGWMVGNVGKEEWRDEGKDGRWKGREKCIGEGEEGGL